MLPLGLFDFVATDIDGELVALGDDVDWPASRSRAVAILDKLPPLAEITATQRALDQAITVKPLSGEYQIFASRIMLDVLGIRGDDGVDAYLEMLAYSLSDVWCETCDPRGTPHWIPMSAFAKAIKAILADRASWNHFGGTKRPPIPDILARAKEGRSDLMSILRDVETMVETRERLIRIIDTVNSYEEND